MGLGVRSFRLCFCGIIRRKVREIWVSASGRFLGPLPPGLTSAYLGLLWPLSVLLSFSAYHSGEADRLPFLFRILGPGPLNCPVLVSARYEPFIGTGDKILAQVRGSQISAHRKTFNETVRLLQWVAKSPSPFPLPKFFRRKIRVNSVSLRLRLCLVFCSPEFEETSSANPTFKWRHVASAAQSVALGSVFLTWGCCFCAVSALQSCRHRIIAYA
jgi:hypothetical protein